MSMQLNSLLHWAVANTPARDPATSGPSTPAANGAALHPSDPLHPDHVPSDHLLDDGVIPVSSTQPPVRRSDLTSDMLDAIMGKSDTVIMKEKMEVILNEKEELSNRLVALDDFEMLIESLDNANNLESLKMWPSLVGLLSSSEDEVVQLACWICGTAIQNNPKAQASFHAQSPLPKIYSLISSSDPSVSPQTRAKALYCLSAALKHWPDALTDLSQEDNRGWAVLNEGLKDPDPTIRRKVAFLINTLILQSDEQPEIKKIKETGVNPIISGMISHSIISTLISSCTSPLPTGKDGENSEPDWDFLEKVVRAIVSADERGGLDEQQRKEVGNVWSKWGEEGRWEDLGFSELEGVELSARLGA